MQLRFRTSPVPAHSISPGDDLEFSGQAISGEVTEKSREEMVKEMKMKFSFTVVSFGSTAEQGRPWMGTL